MPTFVNSDKTIDTMYKAKTPSVRVMTTAWNAGVALMILVDQRKYMTPMIQIVPKPACRTIPEYAPSYTNETPPMSIPSNKA